MVIMALTCHRGESATVPGDFRLIMSSATPFANIFILYSVLMQICKINAGNFLNYGNNL